MRTTMIAFLFLVTFQITSAQEVIARPFAGDAVPFTKGTCTATPVVYRTSRLATAQTVEWVLNGPEGVEVRATDFSSPSSLTNPSSGLAVCTGNSKGIYFFVYKPRPAGESIAHLMFAGVDGTKPFALSEGQKIEYLQSGAAHRATILALSDLVVAGEREELEVLAKVNGDLSQYATEVIFSMVGEDVVLVDSFGKIDANSSRESSVTVCAGGSHAWVIDAGSYTLARMGDAAPTLYAGSLGCSDLLADRR